DRHTYRQHSLDEDHGKDAEEVFADQLSHSPSMPAFSEVGRWGFWRREASSKHAPGPQLIIHQESLARAGEQFQVLRANLESWAQEHNKRVILVTSSVHREGKSFV